MFAGLAGWGEIAFTGGRDIPLLPSRRCFTPSPGAILGAFAYRKFITVICAVRYLRRGREGPTATTQQNVLRCNLITGQNYDRKIYRCARPWYHQLPRGRYGS